MLQKKEESKKETLEEERRRREKEAKEKELKVAVPEKKERVERIPLKKEEEHILIPLIKIQEISMLELEKLELSKEIPKIEKVRRTVSVPIIELQEPSLMLKEYELDYKIPRVEKTKKLLTIPIVRVKSPPRVSISLMEFDTEIRKPSQIILPKVRVPVYRKAILTLPKLLLESFDSTINEQLKECLERKEEVERKLPGERVKAELIEPTPSLSAEEEIPNFYDIFMEGKFGRLTTVDRAACIILPRSYPESYVDSVGLICREFYRIKKGGKPSPRILSTGSKEEVEKSLKAGERIFIVDDSKCELINLNRIKGSEEGLIKEINWEHLYDRLRELFSQDYGFVIFHLDGKWVNDFISKLKKVAHMIPKLFIVKFKDMSPKVKEEIARMCWGFVSSRGKTFDEVFCNAEKAFYDRLEKIKEDDWLMHCTKPHMVDHESSEHRSLKALVVKIIAKEKGIKRELIPEKISTEHKINNFIVDIFVKDTNEFIEVETLYKTESNPIDKLDHDTLQKYVAHNITEVKIVMLPMPLLTYLKSLVSLRRIYKERINVKFYTVDVENEKLVPLEDIIKRLKELKKQIDKERLEIEISKLKKIGFTEEEIKGLLRGMSLEGG